MERGPLLDEANPLTAVLQLQQMRRHPVYLLGSHPFPRDVDHRAVDVRRASAAGRRPVAHIQLRLVIGCPHEPRYLETRAGEFGTEMRALALQETEHMTPRITQTLRVRVGARLGSPHLGVHIKPLAIRDADQNAAPDKLHERISVQHRRQVILPRQPILLLELAAVAVIGAAALRLRPPCEEAEREQESEILHAAS